MISNYKTAVKVALFLVVASASRSYADTDVIPNPPRKPYRTDFVSTYRIRSLPGGRRVLTMVRDVKENHQRLLLTGKRRTVNGRKWVQVRFGKTRGWISQRAVRRKYNVASAGSSGQPPKPKDVKPSAAAQREQKSAAADAPGELPVIDIAAEEKKKPTPPPAPAPRATPPPKTEVKAAATTPPTAKPVEVPAKRAENPPPKQEAAKPDVEKSAAVAPPKPNAKESAAPAPQAAKPPEKKRVMECAATNAELKGQERLAAAIKKSGVDPFVPWKGEKSDMIIKKGKNKSVAKVHPGINAMGARTWYGTDTFPMDGEIEVCVPAENDQAFVNMAGKRHPLGVGKGIYSADERGSDTFFPTKVIK